MGPLLGDFASGLGVDFAITRSVRDAATLLEAVHGDAPGDPYVAPPPLRRSFFLSQCAVRERVAARGPCEPDAG